MKWVSIPGFDGYYASDCGQIKGPKGLRKLCKTPRGYLRISLHGKTVGVHRLVLFAFHGGQKDVAAILGISYKAFNMALRRAKEKTNEAKGRSE